MNDSVFPLTLMVSMSPGRTLAAHHVLQICAEPLQIIVCCHCEFWDSQQHSVNCQLYVHLVFVTGVTPVTASWPAKGQR